MAESEEVLKSLMKKLKGRVKKSGLKLNIQNNFMANRWGNNGNNDRLYFLALQNH